MRISNLCLVTFFCARSMRPKFIRNETGREIHFPCDRHSWGLWPPRSSKIQAPYTPALADCNCPACRGGKACRSLDPAAEVALEEHHLPAATAGPGNAPTSCQKPGNDPKGMKRL